MSASATQGFVSVPGGRVWYRIVGSGDGIPLLTLHGGPGAGHDYLEALASERPVVLYDQLGCRKSDQPEDPSLWRIGRYVQELAALREALDLNQIHLFGHSWGGWLAIEYMMGEPTGVVSLILGSTSASARQFAEETARLKATLPASVLDILHRYEAVGDYHNPEYEEATMAFYTRFVCRLDPWPEPLMRTLTNVMSNPVPYETIRGPNGFTFTGNLKDWDRTGRLRQIRVPTLVTCGRYDELTPACAETIHQGIPNSGLHIFEQSAHMTHLEETEHFLEVLTDFLRRSEREFHSRHRPQMTKQEPSGV